MTTPEKTEEKKAEKKDEKQGGGGGGMDLWKMWGIAILVLVLLMVGVLHMFADQLNHLFAVIRNNTGAILIILGAIGIAVAIAKYSKKP